MSVRDEVTLCPCGHVPMMCHRTNAARWCPPTVDAVSLHNLTSFIETRGLGEIMRTPGAPLVVLPVRASSVPGTEKAHAHRWAHLRDHRVCVDCGVEEPMPPETQAASSVPDTEKGRKPRVYLHEDGRYLSIGFTDTQDTLLPVPDAMGHRDRERVVEWVAALRRVLGEEDE